MFNLFQPVDSETAANKANKDGSDLTSPSNWRAGLDVPSHAAARRGAFLAGQPGVFFDGSTSENIAVALKGAVLGTGPVSVWIRFRCPSANPSVALNIFSLFVASANQLSCDIDTSGNLRLWRTYASTLVSSSAALIGTYGGKVIDLVITRSNASGSTADLVAYVDGSAVISVAGAASGGIDFVDGVVFNVGNYGTGAGTNALLGTVYRAVVFNRSLSAADVASLIEYGISPEDQWGVASSLYSSNFSAGADSWADATATSTVTAPDTAPDASTQWISNLRGGSSGRLDLTRSISTLVAGKRYRATASVYNANIGSNNYFTFGTGGAAPVAGTSVALVASGAGGTVSGEFVATNTNLRLGPAASADGANAASVAAASKWFAKSVSVTRVGAIIDLDFTWGVGFQFPDRSGNGFTADAAGSPEHVIPLRGGSLVFEKRFLHSEISASTGTTKIVDLPAKAGLVRIEMRVDTAMDSGRICYVGTAGSPTKWGGMAGDATGNSCLASSAGNSVAQSESTTTPIYVHKSASSTTGYVSIRIEIQIRA